MGSHPYEYFVPFQADIDAALQELRQREFAAGRYNPVMPFPPCPVTANSPAPGAQHDSIEEAFADAAEDGTRSILDLFQVTDEPEFCAVCPIPDDILQSLYGTTRPTREMVMRNMDFTEDIERGQGVYVILYKDDEPHEILFTGYSFD